MRKYISNSSLELANIPAPGSNYYDISEFALAFDGYELPNCAELANSRSAKTLSELRAVLFFEQRRFRHFGCNPEGKDLEYVRILVQEIRAKVGNGELQ